MSDNKKIVRFDKNDKLVIEDNNAITTIEGTTSKIEGVYEISDNDVERLLLLINDNTIVKEFYSYSITGTIMGSIYMPGSRTTYIITSDKAVDEALSVVSKEYNKLDEEYKELKNAHTTMKEKYDKLIAKVEKHNKNRLFNKIKLD